MLVAVATGEASHDHRFTVPADRTDQADFKLTSN
jgi:hypothetical protein